MPEVTGFTRPTAQQIITRIQNDINAGIIGADSRLRRSVLKTLAYALGGASHLLYGFIGYVAEQILVDTASIDWLPRHGAIWGIARKAASKTTLNVTFTGINTSIIPLGTRIRRADGIQFETTAEGTIAAGVALLPVSSLEPGADTATPAGTALSLVSAVLGIQSTATVDTTGIVDGTDAEDVEAWRDRILARIKDPPAGGKRTDYEKWALEVPGVTRVWVFPLELGIGTVVVRFVRDLDVTLIPDAGEVQAVQDYINARRPVTADVTVVAPTAVPQDFTIALDPDSATIRTAVEAEIDDLVAREATPGATLYLSRISEAISRATGEYSHVLSVPAADRVFTSGQIGTKGTITWA